MPVYAADRLTAYYTGPLGSHRMSFWKTAVATPTTFIAAVRAIINNMRFVQYQGTSWTNADYQAAGDNFSVPVAWTPITSSTGANPTAADTVGEYVNFAGRSLTTGKRVRLFLFEQVFGPDTDMRIDPGDNAEFDDIVAQLDNVSPSVGAIDGAPVVWKTYGNLGINDYWIRRARTGA
jgi:hypothetical protein